MKNGYKICQEGYGWSPVKEPWWGGSAGQIHSENCWYSSFM